MGKYVVLKSFSDLQDQNHIYRPGDEFPRAGIDVSIDRLTSLSSSDNKIGSAVIEYVDDQAASEPSTKSQKSDPTPASVASVVEEDKKTDAKPKKRGRRSKSE